MPGYRVPDDVAWIDKGEELFLARVPDGTTLLLRDTGRLIWIVAGNRGHVVDQVANLVGLPAIHIAADVNAFVDDLIARGLLVAE